jgi:hypothetical protein
MELLLSASVLTLLLVIIIIVSTRGRPMRFIVAFGDTIQSMWSNRVPIGLTAICVFLAAGFVYFFYASPATNIGPAQPISFSHRLHAGVKAIDCRFCHPYVMRSIYPGLPPVEKCLYCHNYIIANHPEIQKEHAYFNDRQPVPWVKVFYLPEHVLFNHQRHIRKEIACESCHGDIKSMDRLKGERFKMGFCVQCHRARGADLDCWLACHS